MIDFLIRFHLWFYAWFLCVLLIRMVVEKIFKAKGYKAFKIGFYWICTVFFAFQYIEILKLEKLKAVDMNGVHPLLFALILVWSVGLQSVLIIRLTKKRSENTSPPPR